MATLTQRIYDGTKVVRLNYANAAAKAVVDRRMAQINAFIDLFSPDLGLPLGIFNVFRTNLRSQWAPVDTWTALILLRDLIQSDATLDVKWFEVKAPDGQAKRFNQDDWTDLSLQIQLEILLHVLPQTKHRARGIWEGRGPNAGPEVGPASNHMMIRVPHK